MGTSFLQESENSTKLFNRSDAQHSCLANLFARLIDVCDSGASTSENDNVAVHEIREVLNKSLESLLFLVFEEACLLLDELSDDLSQEMQRVLLVLSICILACRGIDDSLEDLWLNQKLEEGLVVAELVKNARRVEGLVQLVLILR